MERRDFIKSLTGGIASPFLFDLFNYKKTAKEFIIPFKEPPENIIPGLPNWYSSVCMQCPAGCGIQVKVREGRPKKIEGNPNHPINKGRICARGQAGLQVLYNPDRIKTPLIKKNKGKKFTPISWEEATSKLATYLDNLSKKGQSDHVAFLTSSLRGNLGNLITSFMSKYGSSNLFSYEFLNDTSLSKANEICFGNGTYPDYDLSNTKYILSFDGGFLDNWLSPVKTSVSYGEMRDPSLGNKGNRGWLVQFESRLSLTGANADEWYPIKPETEGLLALGIAHEIVNNNLHHPSINPDVLKWKDALESYNPHKTSKKIGLSAEKISKIAKEFASNQPGLAVCGSTATSQLNGTSNAIAVNILNFLVGNIGKKGGVRFSAPSYFSKGIEKNISYKDLLALSKKIDTGLIKVLFFYNTNPVFNLPKSSGFAKTIEQTPFIVSFSSFMDETTAMADLILPDHSYLESWGDYIPISDNGHKTIGIQQPAMKPLHDTRQIGDTIISLSKKMKGGMSAAFPWNNYYEYLKNAWSGYYLNGKKAGTIKEATFENYWIQLLINGGAWDTNESFVNPAKKPSPGLLPGISTKPIKVKEEYFHFLIYPSNKLYDGRGANQPWLQQLPEPLITTTWDSWVEINPETAKEHNINEGDIIQIETYHGKIAAPAYLYQAIEPNTIAMPIGYGHTEYGRYAKKRGENPLRIISPIEDKLSGNLAWNATKVLISKTGDSINLIKTEPNVTEPGLENGLREMDRHIVQWISPEELEKEAKEELKPLTATPNRDHEKPPTFPKALGLEKYRTAKYHHYKYRWGMVIDLDKCTGCSSCMVACYAENNLPIVSPIEMERRRHKNWMRIDRYWEGEYPNIRAKQIPMNCAQCGNAPCELVCPVYDTYHTPDGLNAMVYQRCIGCRYCNANCPYRARVFNWFSPEWPKPLDQQLSTEVSVRTSGISEKCTFCIQRIRSVKDKAKDEDRDVRDGEIQPACAQTCPSGAITFGNLMDIESKVSMLTRNPRRYRVLEEFNMEPAVIYLKAVREGAESESHE